MFAVKHIYLKIPAKENKSRQKENKNVLKFINRIYRITHTEFPDLPHCLSS